LGGWFEKTTGGLLTVGGFVFGGGAVAVRMGEWANGRMGEWASGRVGEWPSGRVAEWPSGRKCCA